MFNFESSNKCIQGYSKILTLITLLCLSINIIANYLIRANGLFPKSALLSGKPAVNFQHIMNFID